MILCGLLLSQQRHAGMITAPGDRAYCAPRRYRSVVQLHQGAGDPLVHPGSRGRPGRVPHAAGQRAQEFRKCIERFLCQNVCHVIRDHADNESAPSPAPNLMRTAELEMHPADTADRRGDRPGRLGPRLLQHHQVLHRGLPREHQDHRQRAHPHEGTRGRPQVRSAGLARQQDRPAAPSRHASRPRERRVNPTLPGLYVAIDVSRPLGRAVRLPTCRGRPGTSRSHH